MKKCRISIYQTVQIIANVTDSLLLIVTSSTINVYVKLHHVELLQFLNLIKLVYIIDAAFETESI